MKDTWSMTPDEARKYILQNWFDGDENVNAFVCGDEEYTAMAIAVEALEATKWHYPLKGEYPTEGGKYFCCHKYNDNLIPTIGIYNIHHKSWCGESGIAWNKDPFAWRYIEPPKEEE